MSRLQGPPKHIGMQRCRTHTYKQRQCVFLQSYPHVSTAVPPVTAVRLDQTARHSGLPAASGGWSLHSPMRFRRLNRLI